MTPTHTRLRHRSQLVAAFSALAVLVLLLLAPPLAAAESVPETPSVGWLDTVVESLLAVVDEIVPIVDDQDLDDGDDAPDEAGPEIEPGG